MTVVRKDIGTRARSPIVLVLIGAVLTGCAGDPAISRGGTEMSGELRTIHDTRLLSGACLYGWPEPEAAFLAGLAAAVLPSLIDKGVATLAGAIKDAGAAATYKVAVERPLQLAKDRTDTSGATVKGMPECLQLARGRFFEEPPVAAPPASAWFPAGTSYKSLQEIWPRLLDSGLTLAGEPELFVEMPVFSARDGTALAVAVRQVTYTKPLGSRPFRSPNEAHGLAVNVAFLTADKTKPEDVPVASLDLGKLTPGHATVYRTPYELRNAQSSGQVSTTATGGTITRASAAGPGGGSTASVPATTVTGGGGRPGSASGPGSSGGAPGTGLNPRADTTLVVTPIVSTNKMLPLTSRWVPLALTESAKPVTVWVQAVDTQDPNKFLTFLGETLEASKDQTGQVLKGEFVPGEKERLRVEEVKNNRENVKGYFTTYATAETKLTDYRAKAFDGSGKPIVSADAFKAALDARAAQEDANTAALIAGRDPPYNELIKTGLHRP